MWGVIGGSGFSAFEGVKTREIYKRQSETPFGPTSAPVELVEVQGSQFLFISRHGHGHSILPSDVPYCANMYALKALGAIQVLSLSSVGSLEECCKPNDIVLPSQYINATKGQRRNTYCQDGIVGHVSLGDPTCAYWHEILQGMSGQMNTTIHADKTSVVIEGPQFSTRAESKMYQQWGAHVIGMTNYPEYALAREIGLGYVPVSFVTDYDAWRTTEASVHIDEIIARVEVNNRHAYEVINALVGCIAPDAISLGYLENVLAKSLLNKKIAETADVLDEILSA